MPHPLSVVPPAPVRLATMADEEAVFDLLVDLWRHNERGWGFPFRPEIVQACIESGTRPEPHTRTDPTNRRYGLIGVIDGERGRIDSSIGLFLDPVVWFSDARGLTELWLYVRPEARGVTQHYRKLFNFSRWAHDFIKGDMKNYPLPFPLTTGFMHHGSRMNAMERLWAMFSGARKCGVLFMRR